MTVLSHIFYLWRFKTVKLPWIDHNASRYAQIQDGVAIVEKLNYELNFDLSKKNEIY